jgi:hypothetical protein
MPCSIVRILDADNVWLRAQYVSAFRQGKLTHQFVETQAENDRRIREHRAEAVGCDCQLGDKGNHSPTRQAAITARVTDSENAFASERL